MIKLRTNLGLTTNPETGLVDFSDFDADELVQKTWEEILQNKNLAKTVYQLIDEDERTRSKFLYLQLQKKRTVEKLSSNQQIEATNYLVYLFLNSLDTWRPEEIVIFFRDNLVGIVKLEAEVSDWLLDRLSFLDASELADLAAKIMNAAKANSNFLGGLTAGQWLKSYLTRAIAEKRSVIDEINFVNTDEGAKKLTPQDRELLLKVLLFYDKLEFPEGVVGKKIITEDKEQTTEARPKVGAMPLTPKPVTLLDDVIGKITRGELDKKNLAAYLKVVLSKPIDFKQVIGLVNELKRRGYPQLMDIIYFDPTAGQYHWKE